MKKIDSFVSNNAPNVKEGLWIKPVAGGVALYYLEGGKWNPLVLVDDQGTASDADGVVQDLIGTNNDNKNKNTIYGAKAYAKDQADTLKGSAEDDKDTMTLYGLKAYIDDKTAG